MTPKPSLKHLDVILATWFGSGYMPKAPGTWGSLAALPFGIVLMVFGGWQGLVLFTGIAFMAGLWSAQGYMARTGTHDPGAVVIDEVAGVWLAMIPIPFLLGAIDLSTPLFWGLVIAAFGLFRVFDIFKPWPVSWADRLDGALGVMLDDIFAGVYAAAILYILYSLVI